MGLDKFNTDKPDDEEQEQEDPQTIKIPVTVGVEVSKDLETECQPQDFDAVIEEAFMQADVIKQDMKEALSASPISTDVYVKRSEIEKRVSEQFERAFSNYP